MERALAFRQPYSGSEPSLTGRTGGGEMAYAGAESVGSVLVHRGALPTATVATSAGVTKIAPAATSNAKIVRVGGSRGVRVYRGATGPASGEDLSDQATID
jgi:hypothetical protein